MATAKTNADAIRYALKTNGGAEDSEIVTWLKQFGREVNRGQVYRVKQQLERKRLAAAAAQAGT
ncbi:hypothetical protein [Streptomyces goshikiensis]|uniref:hypothetical protein n=1 Tax=Streptomyces goshikiensis TaxID=1942 RepID=UPI00365829ED